jgi:hypothetical protein
MGKQSAFFINFLPPTLEQPMGLRFLGLTAGGRLTISGFFFLGFGAVCVVCPATATVVFVVVVAGLRRRRTAGDATAFGGAAMSVSTRAVSMGKINTPKSNQVLAEMCG